MESSVVAAKTATRWMTLAFSPISRSLGAIRGRATSWPVEEQMCIRDSIDAPMLKPALDTMNLDSVDLLFLENIGNLVCPAEFDTGATCSIMLLSVPEGDDKVLKYPLMFTVCDLLLVTKTDCQAMFDFDLKKLTTRVHQLNPNMKIIPVSSKTGENMDAWISWLKERREAFIKN